MLALGGGLMGKSGFGRELGRGIIQFTPPQRVEEIAREDDPLPLPAREALFDQVIDPRRPSRRAPRRRTRRR